MADESEIRRENFKQLAKTPKAAHETLGGTYSYWRDLMSLSSKPFGEKVARRIEAAYNLPPGVLDVPGMKSASGSAFTWPFSAELLSALGSADAETVRKAENGARSHLDLPPLPKPKS